MTITLAGKITDITNRSPDQVTRATVKYPTYAIGEAGALATSAPREVQVAADGSFTLDVTAGKGWLFLEGPGWTESVGFVASSGMTAFIEAVANFDARPIYDLIRELIATMGGATEAALQDLVDAAESFAETALSSTAARTSWYKGSLPAGDVSRCFGESWAGQWGIDNGVTAVANITGLPFANAFGHLQVLTGKQGFSVQIATRVNGEVWVRGQAKMGFAEWNPWKQIATADSVVAVDAKIPAAVGRVWLTENDLLDNLGPGWAQNAAGAVAAAVGAPEDMMGTTYTAWLISNGAVRIQTFTGRSSSGAFKVLRRYYNGTWSPWVEDHQWQNPVYFQGTPTDVDSLPAGTVYIPSKVYADQAGMPTSGIGSLTTWRTSDRYASQMWASASGTVAELWLRTKTSGAWGKWLKVGASAGGGGLSLMELNPQTDLSVLPDGLYSAPNTSVAQSLGMPLNLPGVLLQSGDVRQYTNSKGVYVQSRANGVWGTWAQAGVVDGYTPLQPPTEIPWYQEDQTDSTAHLLDQDKHGPSGYAINTQNWPTAGTGWCLHHYSNNGPGLIIDNCRSKAAIHINNTQNRTITPDYKGDGSFFKLGPWNDADNYKYWCELTNDLVWFNNTEKVMSFRNFYAYGTGEIVRFLDRAGNIVATIDGQGNLKSKQIDDLVARIEALEAKIGGV